MSTVIDGSASVTINSGAVLGITSGTAVASTSGTSITFTGIPSWVKRITLMFNNVSTSGTSNYLMQLGSGSAQATGYLSTSTNFVTTSVGGTTVNSTGFLVPSGGASAAFQGMAIFTLLGSNIWTCLSNLAQTDASRTVLIAGSVPLSGTLDRILVTTVNGTDTFDAGSINILYE